MIYGKQIKDILDFKDSLYVLSGSLKALSRLLLKELKALECNNLKATDHLLEEKTQLGVSLDVNLHTLKKNWLQIFPDKNSATLSVMLKNIEDMRKHHAQDNMLKLAWNGCVVFIKEIIVNFTEIKKNIEGNKIIINKYIKYYKNSSIFWSSLFPKICSLLFRFTQCLLHVLGVVLWPTMNLLHHKMPL